MLAARVCIVLQSLASASQDSAAVSWLSGAVAILRMPGIAAVASRSRMTMPPWLSVTIRAHELPPCQRRSASSNAAFASASLTVRPLAVAVLRRVASASLPHSPVIAYAR